MLQETVDTFEQVQQLIVKHVPVPQMLQETVDPFERVQQQIVEHVPVLQVLQETFHPLERGQQQTVVRRLWYPSRKCPWEETQESMLNKSGSEELSRQHLSENQLENVQKTTARSFSKDHER